MKTFHNNQTKLSRKNTKIGLLLGVMIGLLIGLTIDVTVFTVSGGSLAFAIGVVTVFTLAFAAGGTFMGLLFDVDDYERNRETVIKVHSEPMPRRLLNLQPIVRYLQ